MKELTAAAIMGICNLGMDMPSLNSIRQVESSARTVDDAVVMMVGSYIESDDMQASFNEEVESWVGESGLVEKASFKVFESYNVKI